MSYVRFYMFRSTRTIFRELILSLAKVTLFRSNQWKYVFISCAVLWQHAATTLHNLQRRISTDYF